MPGSAGLSIGGGWETNAFAYWPSCLVGHKAIVPVMSRTRSWYEMATCLTSTAPDTESHSRDHGSARGAPLHEWRVTSRGVCRFVTRVARPVHSRDSANFRFDRGKGR